MADELEVIETRGSDALWEWFGLSYASWLTIPRVLMHEMPDEWQGKMAALLREYDATFTFPGFEAGTMVSLKRDGKFIAVPRWLLNYRHPDTASIDAFARAGEQDNTNPKEQRT